MTQTELKKIDAYWRASNYLAAGQLYLLDNPLVSASPSPTTQAAIRSGLSNTAPKAWERALCRG